MGNDSKTNPTIIPKAQNFIEEYAGLIQVLVTHDGLVALEILKPDLNLMITADNQTTYTGEWTSIARIIISPEIASRLRDELNNVLKMYETGEDDDGTTD